MNPRPLALAFTVAAPACGDPLVGAWSGLEQAAGLDCLSSTARTLTVEEIDARALVVTLEQVTTATGAGPYCVGSAEAYTGEAFALGRGERRYSIRLLDATRIDPAAWDLACELSDDAATLHCATGYGAGWLFTRD